VLNTRDAFAAAHPDAVRRVNAVYEQARLWALANPAEFKALIVKETKLPEAVVAKQLERTDLSNPSINATVAESILAAGLALQKAGVVKPEVDVKATVAALVDTSFALPKK
jgi:sulfonate transport system substrate-binding protein